MLKNSPDESNAPLSININGIQPGDLVFFVNYYYASSSTIDTPIEERYEADRQPYVDHVAMYAGKNELGFHQLIHSIAPTEESKKDLTKVAGLCHTTFRPLLNQKDDDDAESPRFDVFFHIVRFDNKQIAQEALKYMQKWIGHNIPYDEKRLNAKLEKEETQEPEDFMRLAQQSYDNGPGLYRAIKFAARRDFSLTRPKPQDLGRGLTCSMLITLAFQIAELAPFVIAGANPRQWVSDKRGAIKEGASPRYQKYLLDIGNKTPNDTSKNQCGLFFWNDKESADTFRHRSLCVDSKIIGAAGIYEYVMANPSAWHNLGALAGLENASFSPESKQAYKQETLSTATDAHFYRNSTVSATVRYATPPQQRDEIPLKSPTLTTTPDRLLFTPTKQTPRRSPNHLTRSIDGSPLASLERVRTLQEKLHYSLSKNSNTFLKTTPEKENKKSPSPPKTMGKL